MGRSCPSAAGAVSVTAYEEGGYLPEAMLNYLARLGWSHGDEELFSREQLVAWFDGTHLNKSPAQWDPVKLLWVNAHYIKTSGQHAPGEPGGAAVGQAGHPVGGRNHRHPSAAGLCLSRTVATPRLRWPPGPPSFMAT
jgi:hypothetical protein